MNHDNPGHEADADAIRRKLALGQLAQPPAALKRTARIFHGLPAEEYATDDPTSTYIPASPRTVSATAFTEEAAAADNSAARIRRLLGGLPVEVDHDGNPINRA